MMISDMNTGDPQPFDDAALRGAIKSACADETAPAALRQQIAGMLAQGREAPPARFRYFSARLALYGLAAAAVIVLVSGLAIYRYLDNSPPGVQPVYVQALPSRV